MELRMAKDPDLPTTFVCPLTLNIMEEPVTDCCAHSFEKKAILDRICQGQSTCPISGKELTERDLVRNDVLAERIEKWKWEQKMIKSGAWDHTELDSLHSTDDDTEIEDGRKKRIRRSKRIQKSAPQFTLLPQELAAMEQQEMQSLELARAMRRKRMQRNCLLLTVVVVIAGIVIASAKLLRDRENNQ